MCCSSLFLTKREGVVAENCVCIFNGTVFVLMKIYFFITLIITIDLKKIIITLSIWVQALLIFNMNGNRCCEKLVFLAEFLLPWNHFKRNSILCANFVFKLIIYCRIYSRIIGLHQRLNYFNKNYGQNKSLFFGSYFAGKFFLIYLKITDIFVCQNTKE